MSDAFVTDNEAAIDEERAARAVLRDQCAMLQRQIEELQAKLERLADAAKPKATHAFVPACEEEYGRGKPAPETSDAERERCIGLVQKYHVTRVDGASEPGAKHDGCRYFVLDVTHDKYAPAALYAYAAACGDEFPALAADLQALADAQKERAMYTAAARQRERADAAKAATEAERARCVALVRQFAPAIGTASSRLLMLRIEEGEQST